MKMTWTLPMTMIRTTMAVTRDGLSEEEVLELEASLTPVRLMLTKVSKFQTVD
jgi:hypothetical protein